MLVRKITSNQHKNCKKGGSKKLTYWGRQGRHTDKLPITNQLADRLVKCLVSWNACAVWMNLITLSIINQNQYQHFGKRKNIYIYHLSNFIFSSAMSTFSQNHSENASNIIFVHLLMWSKNSSSTQQVKFDQRADQVAWEIILLMKSNTSWLNWNQSSIPCVLDESLSRIYFRYQI